MEDYYVGDINFKAYAYKCYLNKAFRECKLLREVINNSNGGKQLEDIFKEIISDVGRLLAQGYKERSYEMALKTAIVKNGAIELLLKLQDNLDVKKEILDSGRIIRNYWLEEHPELFVK